MDSRFLTLLHKIRADHGISVLTDTRRLRSLLADYAAGGFRGESRIFLLALEEGLVARLLKEQNLSEAFLQTQALHFSSTYFFAEDAACRLVWCWAEILGLRMDGKVVLFQNIPDANNIPAMVSKTLPPAGPPAITGGSVFTGKASTNSIGMEFVLIPAGSFMMGSPEYEKGRFDNEKQHKVTLTQPFYLGKFPVTQAQWQAVMGNNPSHFKNKTSHPVESVSWKDVKAFITQLNLKEKTWGYRLPAEAEWEYAARAGSTTAYCFGDDVARLDRYAWYDDNSGDATHPVGVIFPNAWGLHDMHGNVWEWVEDWYDDYPAGSVVDPTGPGDGESRILRGGSWINYAQHCRSAIRKLSRPDFQINFIGFRLAFSPSQ